MYYENKTISIESAYVKCIIQNVQLYMYVKQAPWNSRYM